MNFILGSLKLLNSPLPYRAMDHFQELANSLLQKPTDTIG
jgi:hypothetical protein